MANHHARQPNRLIEATSPYLLQHAHNPVDWHEWGEAALDRARREDKPILLSIGYSACHWCHVMERESFEDDETAALMNASFVPVKVDREERPDLDDIYMAATLALNHGQGGWPMTVFLTPDQKPFFAGTYFPPEDRYGRPGFKTLLRRIALAWSSERSALVSQSDQLLERLRAAAAPPRSRTVGDEQIEAAVRELASEYDALHGGFGAAPKFPPTGALSLLLRWHHRTGEPEALAMVEKTLDAMARGGIYDHIGGGFARYSTDERWLVPHFEKMLYDNALLASVYLEAYQLTGDSRWSRTAHRTLDWVLREMTAPEGGFYSALDADSEGEEGKFYVWTAAEVDAVLGPEEGELFRTVYDIDEGGNWEGKSIPNLARPLAEAASRLGIDAVELEARLDALRARLYLARRERVAPGRDDKILTAWNALMVSAMSAGYRVLGDGRYLEAAAAAAELLHDKLRRPDGSLLRSYRAGRATAEGTLEDYAYLANALVDLYEAGGDEACLRWAAEIGEQILRDFADPNGGFFTTSSRHERLILRQKEAQDGATPSSNAVAAEALARLGAHYDRDHFRRAAERAAEAFGLFIERVPRAFCRTLAVVDFILEGPVEICIAGKPGESDFESLRAGVNARYLPNRVIEYVDPSHPSRALPLVSGKGWVEERAALYVCRDFACQQPVTDPRDVADALAAGVDEARRARSRSLSRPLAASATAIETAAAARRHAELSSGYSELGRTGLTVSRFGFGTYRVDDGTPDHRAALEKALRSGVSLIDTSTNYTDGSSERLIGQTLRDLATEGRLRREQVVVVSKIGYAQGTNLEIAQRRETRGVPFPEMVKYADGLWHCIHPEWLDDQLERSLARLQLETLDVLLLHNPEYFLTDARRRGLEDVAALRIELDRRFEQAFRWLEEQVERGRVRWYGVSSNTVALGSEHPEATSLGRMLEVARRAGGAKHHFAALQVPLNLLEPAAAALPTESGHTLLEAAVASGTAVLVNRPLNAIKDDRLIRLGDFPEARESADVAEAERRVREIEQALAGELDTSVRTSNGQSIELARFFAWANELADLRRSLEGVAHWREVEEQAVRPQLGRLVRLLDTALSGELAARWQARRAGYLAALDELFDAILVEAARDSQAQADAAAAPMRRVLPERKDEPLARQALWVLASTPGVSSVLVGMRRPSYVDDALAVMRWRPLEAATALGILKA